MLGSIISAGAGLLGGIFGNKSAESNMQAQMDLQKQFAKNSVRWRVADAKAAGIHPLAALGAQTHSYAPMAFSDSLGPAMASAGQDIGRAIDATRTGSERADAVSTTVRHLTIQRMGLENELLASQIAKVRQAGHPPPLPAGGSSGGSNPTAIAAGGNSILSDGGPYIETSPSPVTKTYPGSPQTQPGIPPESQYFRVGPNEYKLNPSPAFKQAIEDDMLAETEFAVRNRLPQTFGGKLNPPFPAPPGAQWNFDAIRGTYRLYWKGKETPTWYGGRTELTPYSGHR